MKEIYLIETQENAEDLLRRINIDDSKIIIALCPFAMHVFDKMNVKYKIPEDFYTDDELWQVGVKTGKTVEELCKRLDKLALLNSDKLRKRNLKLFTNYNYPLHVVFDTIFSKVFQLKSIFKHFKASKVFCYSTKKLPFYWRGIGFDNRESLYSRILKECNWPEYVDFIQAPKSKKITKLNNKLSYKFASKVSWGKEALKNILKKMNLRYKNNDVCALLGGEYEWGECENDFELINMCIKKVSISYNEQGYAIKDEKLKKEIFNEISDLLNFQGVSVSNLLLPRLMFIYKLGPERCVTAFESANSFIAENSPKALLFSALGTPEWRSAAEAFLQKGIPTFCKTHGVAGVFEVTKVLDNELLHANYYLANNSGAEKFYSSLSTSYTSNNLKVMGTGSPKLVKLKSSKGKTPSELANWLRMKNIDGFKKIGLYVTTLFLQSRSYFYFKPAWSDRTFFNTQKTMINFFKNRNDCLLVWKLHPNRKWARPPYIEGPSENIFTVRDEAQFTDLLNIADFIVIDAPSTTCLEAVTRKVPIFIVTKHVLYFPEAKEKLEKRAVCCEDPEHLVGKIDEYLSFGKYGADINNNSFLDTYVIGQGETDPIKMTVGEVRKVVRS